MSKFQKELFQSTLREIIGGSTNAAFAEKAGISRVYLQSLLSTKAKCPSKEVAINLAKQSKDKIKAFKLLTACGYEDELNEKEKRMLMTEEEWTKTNAEDTKAFCDDYVCKGAFDKREFLNDFNTLYSGSRAFIAFGEPTAYGGSLHKAELVMTVSFIWHSMRLRIQQKLVGVLYGHRSESGDLYMTGMSLAVRDIVDAFPKFERAFASIDPSWPAEDGLMNAPYYFISREYDINAYIKDAPNSAEERLLRAIFGDPDAKEQTIAYYGYGFYLDDEPELLREFLTAHKDALPKDSTGAEFIRKVVEEGEDPANLYCLYDEYTAGPSRIIAEIMSEETGYLFDGFVHENEDPRNRNCVMMEHEMAEREQIDKIKLQKIVEKYARELKLLRIETVIFYEPLDINQWYMKGRNLEYTEN